MPVERGSIPPSSEHKAPTSEGRSSTPYSHVPVVKVQDMETTPLSLLQVQPNTKNEDNHSDNGEDQFWKPEEFEINQDLDQWLLDQLYPEPILELPKEQGIFRIIQTVLSLDTVRSVDGFTLPGTYPSSPCEVAEELPKEDLIQTLEKELNRNDYGNSKNAYDIDLLNLLFIALSSKQLKSHDLFNKLAKKIVPTGAKAIAGILFGETISFLSSGDSGQTSDQVRAVGVGERMTLARTVINDIINAYMGTDIKPVEIYIEAYRLWKESRQSRINALPEDIQKRIRSLDLEVGTFAYSGTDAGLSVVRQQVEEIVWLSNLYFRRKDITYKNDPAARETQRKAINELLEGASTPEQRYQRLINFKRIIDASNEKNSDPEKIVIWRGDLAGGGKTYYTQEQAKALGLPLQMIRLGTEKDITDALHGRRYEYEDLPFMYKIGTLLYYIGDAKIGNTIIYLNEADKAMMGPDISFFKQLWDPNIKTMHVAGIELDISHVIFVGDGNTPINEIFDQAMIERIILSYEDFNTTNPSKRKEALNNAAEEAIERQFLSNEDSRSKITTFANKMIPFIQRLNECTNEQSFRPSQIAAKKVVVFAAAKLEWEEEPDIESAEELTIQIYKRLNPDKNIPKLLEGESQE